MSDPTTSEVVETAAKVGGGGLLGWLLKVIFERTVKRTDDLEAAAKKEDEIRLAKLEERVENNKEKAEERINGVAATVSHRLSALEIKMAKLEERIGE